MDFSGTDVGYSIVVAVLVLACVFFSWHMIHNHNKVCELQEHLRHIYKLLDGRDFEKEKSALEFYARSSSWAFEGDGKGGSSSSIERDRGKKAREALGWRS